MRKKIEWSRLIGAIIICQLAGFVGSIFTFAAIPTWYAQLAKPSFGPPNWIFGPVWTVLYILMGIALYRVWRLGATKKKVSQVLRLFGIHLFVNSGWSIVFFGLHAIFGAVVVICILWGLIAVIMRRFYVLDPWASYLLVPYLLWVSFAAVLNVAFFTLN